MMMAFYTRAETCRSKTVQRFEKLPRLTTATLAAVYLHRKAMSHLKKIIFFSCNSCPTSQEISTIYENWYFTTICKV